MLPFLACNHRNSSMSNEVTPIDLSYKKTGDTGRRWTLTWKTHWSLGTRFLMAKFCLLTLELSV